MKLDTRQMIEKKIFSRVVKTALEKGYTLSLFDTEDYPVKESSKYTEIMKEFYATDEEYLILHDKGKKVGWIWFIYGNDGYDVISDYTANEITEDVIKPANELADKLANQYC